MRSEKFSVESEEPAPSDRLWRRLPAGTVGPTGGEGGAELQQPDEAGRSPAGATDEQTVRVRVPQQIRVAVRATERHRGVARAPAAAVEHDLDRASPLLLSRQPGDQVHHRGDLVLG